jgi:glyoxylase-like metal-dependent hydrolase (beta-lactamase superfamily II)
MKLIFIHLSLLLSLIIGLFLSPALNPLVAQIDSVGGEADRYIQINKLNDRVIIVKLGSDAITVIATQKGLVVIDAGISNSITAKYRKRIEQEFLRNDFAYLINTHSHPDHIGGNQVFSDAVIIGHENCARKMSEYGNVPENIKSGLLKIVNQYTQELDTINAGSDDFEEIMCQKIRYENAYNDLSNGFKLTPPTYTFTDSLCIDMEDATFNLIYFGKAHSESDIIINVPELKILMTGDLFFRFGRMSIDNIQNTDPARWLEVAKWIENRWTSIDLIIGGHGQILSKEDLQAFNKNIRKYAVK